MTTKGTLGVPAVFALRAKTAVGLSGAPLPLRSFAGVRPRKTKPLQSLTRPVRIFCVSARDKKTLRRINNLLKDIDRHPFTGIGKPEPLKGDKQGYWSRRIDEANRIVYKIERETIVIVQCGKHYGV